MRNLSIRTKFFILILLLVIGFGAIISITWFMVNKNLTLSKESNLASVISKTISNINNNILTIQVLEKEFMKKKDLKYVSSIDELNNKIYRDIKDKLIN